jgi:recombination protein RecA
MNANQLKFIEEMEKKFGRNVVRSARDLTKTSLIRIPTPSIALNIAIGGGLPVGRFIQISGAFSSTKSSTTYHIIAEAQKMTKKMFTGMKKVPIPAKEVKHKKGMKPKKMPKPQYEEIAVYEEVPLTVMLIQSETNAWTNEYGESLGIDIDRLLFNECAGQEEALEIAHKAQLNEIADVIVIDSLEALTPTKEYESGMEETVQMGLKQKLFGEYFRKFQATNNKLSREDKFPCTVIGINQLREKIGAYGDPEYTPGGRAIAYTASVDIRLKRGEYITVGTGVNKQIIGQEVKFKVHKNKVGVPLRTGSWDFYNDEGGVVEPGYIDNFKEIIIEGIAYGVINKSGTWLDYGDVKAQGADKFTQAMRDKPELFAEIKEKLMEVALSSYDHSEDEDLEPIVPEEKAEVLM